MLKRVLLTGPFLCVVTTLALPVAGSGSGSDVQTAVPRNPAAVGYLNLHKRHPDGNEGPEEFEREYSLPYALGRLTQVRDFLVSFKALTDKAHGKLGDAELKAVGNTSAEMQNIGFHNIPLVIEGTLLKQEYLLTQARYELAKVNFDRGGVGMEELNRAEHAYALATKRFQLFWDTKPQVN